MRRAADFKALRDEVVREGGLFEVRMSTLRDRFGVARTGPHVREAIEHLLAQHRLRHLPATLPCNQDERILLYPLETDAGRTLGVALRLASWDRAASDSERCA